MADSFNLTQIQQIKQAMKGVLVEELGENYQGRLDRIENKVDLACKIAKDTQEEMAIIGAKVNKHDEDIEEIKSHLNLAI